MEAVRLQEGGPLIDIFLITRGPLHPTIEAIDLLEMILSLSDHPAV